MSDWSPPASGTPCWINIPAAEVPRAKQFYSTVFNWQFMPQEAQSEAYPPDRIAFFSPPDKKRSPGGAISKTDGDTRITKAPKGHAMLYLMVDDLEQYVKKVEAAGGKRTDEIQAEGDHGLMQHFEDTEGNHLGMYMAKPKEDK